MTEMGAAIGPAPVGPPPGADGPRWPPGACERCGVVHRCTNVPSCHDDGWLKPEHDQIWLLPAGQRLVRCGCTATREREAERLRKVSNLEGVAGLTFASFDPTVPDVGEAFTIAQAFAVEPKGWLLFHGNVGAGKTHLAAAVANELVARRRLVVFQVVPTLLDHLKAAFKPDSPVDHDELFASVLNAETLVLDDLGTERATPWAREKLFQLVDHRYLRRLPTVVTTNRKRDQFRDENDQRLASRLWDRGLCQVVAFTGRDYRQRSLAERKVVPIREARKAKGATS